MTGAGRVNRRLAKLSAVIVHRDECVGALVDIRSYDHHFATASCTDEGDGGK
jgi:hypothetical protein